MSIGVRDRKFLWGRAGNRCSFRDCHRPLIVVVDETGDEVVVSNEAHIVAREDDGPRGDPDMPVKDRDSYSNLILLCLEHHVIVDADEKRWTTKRLHKMKVRHERWVEERMTVDDTRALQLDEAYARIVAGWAERADLSRWASLFAGLLAPTPSIDPSDAEQLASTRAWLLNRMWPGSRPNIDAAFENLRRVMDDLSMIIDCWFTDWQGRLRHRPLYKERDVRNFDELAERADWIVDLIHDLVMELTRAANQVLLEVSLSFDPAFRSAEGFLTVERQGAGLYFERIVARYGADEYEPGIYRGLRKFTKDRKDRGWRIGKGMNEAAFRDITPLVLG